MLLNTLLQPALVDFDILRLVPKIHHLRSFLIISCCCASSKNSRISSEAKVLQIGPLCIQYLLTLVCRSSLGVLIRLLLR